MISKIYKDIENFKYGFYYFKPQRSHILIGIALILNCLGFLLNMYEIVIMVKDYFMKTDA